jgi:hypothetical protein
VYRFHTAKNTWQQGRPKNRIRYDVKKGLNKKLGTSRLDGIKTFIPSFSCPL